MKANNVVSLRNYPNPHRKLTLMMAGYTHLF